MWVFDVLALFLFLCRAEERATAYRQVAQEKVQVESKLKQTTATLVRTKKKLETFQQRDTRVREMRRQLNDALVQVEKKSTGQLRAEQR